MLMLYIYAEWKLIRPDFWSPVLRGVPPPCWTRYYFLSNYSFHLFLSRL